MNRLRVVCGDVVRPELDHIAIRIRDVRGSPASLVLGRKHLGEQPKLLEPRDQPAETALVNLEGVVDVDATAAVGDPDLRLPKADPGPTGQDPGAVVRARVQRQPEATGVEVDRPLEVEDLEDDLVDARDGKARTHGSKSR